MKPTNPVPVFALDADNTWEDLENAITGCVEYQSSQRGKILPLLLFAPMTEPENPDAWEPMKATPENLLMVSAERHLDARVLKALFRAKFICGETHQAATFSGVLINFELPLAHVYEQMTKAGIRSFALIHSEKDSPSFFFLRGETAVKAFDAELRKTS